MTTLAIVTVLDMVLLFVLLLKVLETVSFSSFFFLLRHEMTAFKLPTASSLIIGYINAAGCVFILAYSFYWPHFAVYPNPQPQQAALAN